METTCILETPIYEEDGEKRPKNEEDPGENMPENTIQMGPCTPYYLILIRVVPRSRLKLSPFEIVYGRPFRVFVLGTLSLYLEREF